MLNMKTSFCTVACLARKKWYFEPAHHGPSRTPILAHPHLLEAATGALRVDPHPPEATAYVPPTGPLPIVPQMERNFLTAGASVCSILII